MELIEWIVCTCVYCKRCWYCRWNEQNMVARRKK